MPLVEQIVIIGTGRLPCSCLEHCLRLKLNIVGVEPEQQAFSPFKAACSRNNVDYRLLVDKDLLADFFSGIRVPTLVVSAYNIYLFPECVLDNPNLFIVNFHNSLLPRHRGRNAPSWAIFELDRETGITWHKITKRVDSGDVIAQQPIPIDDRMTALELTLRTLEVGAEVFGRILPQLAGGGHLATTPAGHSDDKPHRAKDVPNGGVLDLGWSVKKISAFLRSMDYGKFGVFPCPRVAILGSNCEIGSYRIVSAGVTAGSMLAMDGKHLKVQGDGLEIEMTLR